MWRGTGPPFSTLITSRCHRERPDGLPCPLSVRSCRMSSASDDVGMLREAAACSRSTALGNRSGGVRLAKSITRRVLSIAVQPAPVRVLRPQTSTALGACTPSSSGEQRRRPSCPTAPTGARRPGYRRAPRACRPRHAPRSHRAPCWCSAGAGEAGRPEPHTGHGGAAGARHLACALRAQPPLLRRRRLSQVLQDIAEDFVENVAAFACELVKHRAGETLEVKDLQLAIGALVASLGVRATAPSRTPPAP